jgi:ppGpp synthetase/RelA/SpoT-type nucleotidyltranferase
MPRSLSTNRIDKLGKRLRSSATITAEDRELLEQLRADHFRATAALQYLLLERLDLQSTSRVKAPETIVAKLQRQPTVPLSRMQDIGGLRVVRDMTRLAQNDLRDRLVAALPKDTRVVDRRTDPRSGYRAVHVLTTAEGCRVEIQVRTRLQDLWAQLMEWLADRWGRQMRYGEPPTDPETPAAPESSWTRGRLYVVLLGFADHVASHEEAIEEIERAERSLGEEAPEDARSRLALTRAELQAVRQEILTVFETAIQAGLIGGRPG